MTVRRIKKDELLEELAKTGVDKRAFPIFEEKSETIIFKIYDIDARGGNILKQEFLSRDGDVALSKKVADFSVSRTDAVTIGTLKTYQGVIKKLESQSFLGLEEIKRALEGAISRLPLPLLKTRGKTFNFNRFYYIMGVLNVTPDSFSDGGKFLNPEAALRQAKRMVSEGADIIDVGGESTRPGAEDVSEEEELKRVIPVIKGLRKADENIIISIDTTKSRVAGGAMEAGADIINDISGLRFDPKMIETAKKTGASVVAMHIKGRPRNMQEKPSYKDLIRELLEYFEERISVLRRAGIEEIIIDPGIGFGKRYQDNLKIIKNLSAFKIFHLPILVGLSRKSFIGPVLNEPVENRLFGSLAANAFALREGANIIRVHDVKAHRDLIKTFEAIKNA